MTEVQIVFNHIIKNSNISKNLQQIKLLKTTYIEIIKKLKKMVYLSETYETNLAENIYYNFMEAYKVKFELMKSSSNENLNKMYKNLMKFYRILINDENYSLDLFDNEENKSQLKKDDISYFLKKCKKYVLKVPQNVQVKSKKQFIIKELEIFKKIFELFIFFLSRSNLNNLVSSFPILILLSKSLIFFVNENEITSKDLIGHIYMDELFNSLIKNQMKKYHHNRLILYLFLGYFYQYFNEINEESLKIYELFKNMISENLNFSVKNQDFTKSQDIEKNFCKSCWKLALIIINNYQLLDSNFENELYIVKPKDLSENKISSYFSDFISNFHYNLTKYIENIDDISIFSPLENSLNKSVEIYTEFYEIILNPLKETYDKNSKFYQLLFENLTAKANLGSDEVVLRELHFDKFYYNICNFYWNSIRNHYDTQKMKIMFSPFIDTLREEVTCYIYGTIFKGCDKLRESFEIQLKDKENILDLFDQYSFFEDITEYKDNEFSTERNATEEEENKWLEFFTIINCDNSFSHKKTQLPYFVCFVAIFFERLKNKFKEKKESPNEFSFYILKIIDLVHSFEDIINETFKDFVVEFIRIVDEFKLQNKNVLENIVEEKIKVLDVVEKDRNKIRINTKKILNSISRNEDTNFIRYEKLAGEFYKNRIDILSIPKFVSLLKNLILLSNRTTNYQILISSLNILTALIQYYFQQIKNQFIDYENLQKKIGLGNKTSKLKLAMIYDFHEDLLNQKVIEVLFQLIKTTNKKQIMNKTMKIANIILGDCNIKIQRSFYDQFLADEYNTTLSNIQRFILNSFNRIKIKEEEVKNKLLDRKCPCNCECNFKCNNCNCKVKCACNLRKNFKISDKEEYLFEDNYLEYCELLKDLELFKSLMTFMKLICEGHFTLMQTFLFNQTKEGEEGPEEFNKPIDFVEWLINTILDDYIYFCNPYNLEIG